MSAGYTPNTRRYVFELEGAVLTASNILDRRVSLHELAVIYDATPNHENHELFEEARKINPNRVKRLYRLVASLGELAKSNPHGAHITHD